MTDRLSDCTCLILAEKEILIEAVARYDREIMRAITDFKLMATPGKANDDALLNAQEFRNKLGHLRMKLENTPTCEKPLTELDKAQIKYDVLKPGYGQLGR